MRTIIILLFAGFLAAGLLQASPAGAQTFTSALWRLEQMPGTTGFSPSSRYTIEFLSDGDVDVVADCNRASGPWEADSGTSGDIDITITSTAVAGCPSSYPGQFLDRLDGADHFTFSSDGNTLTLTGKMGDLIFRPASA